jgi:hypothetical protein
MLLSGIDSLLRFALRLRNHYTYTTSTSIPGMTFAKNPPALAASARVFTTATIDPPNHPAGVARGARQADRFACCVLLGCAMRILLRRAPTDRPPLRLLHRGWGVSGGVYTRADLCPRSPILCRRRRSRPNGHSCHLNQHCW